MKKKVCQPDVHTVSTNSTTDIKPRNADLSRSTSPGSRGLSTGAVDILLSQQAAEDHAEAMKKAVLTRLLSERYSFPIWFSQPRPDMNDTETKQARRRRQMATDFETLSTHEGSA